MLQIESFVEILQLVPSNHLLRKLTSSIFSAIKEFANLKYIFQSLCWCISKESINTGSWFVALFSNFKFLYVVTVRLRLSSNMLNVASAQNIEKFWGLLRNWTSSSNWWSDARTTRKSGCTLHSLIKMDGFAMLSFLFTFWSNIHIASLLFSLALPWLLNRWASESVTFLQHVEHYINLMDL